MNSENYHFFTLSFLSRRADANERGLYIANREVKLYLMSDIFPIALFLCIILWALNKYFSFSWLHNLRNSPQTYHKKSTSRFGGIAIYLPLLIVSLSSNFPEYQFLGLALLCSTPIFILGLIDDLNISIHPFMRIFLAVPSPVMYFFLLELRVESVSIPAIFSRYFEAGPNRFALKGCVTNLIKSCTFSSCCHYF